MSRLETIKEKLRSAIENEDEFEKSADLLDRLNQVFRDNADDMELLENISKVCVEDGFLDLFVIIWKKLYIPSFDYDLDGNDGRIFQWLKEVIWNYSDRCPGLCREIKYHEHIVGLLIEELGKFARSLKELEDDVKRYHVKADFGILHNLVRHYDDIKYLIRENEGLDVVACFTKSEFAIIRTYAFVILGFCTEANEIKNLLPDVQVFAFLHELLEDSLAGPDHTSEIYGLSTAEVVQCIAKLARSDANKRALMDTKFLKTAAKILDITLCSFEEISHTLQFIWTLSLDKSANMALCKEDDLMKKIDQISSDSRTPSSVKKDCASILYALKPHAEPPRKRVMLSYQWDSQETMKKLYDYLSGKGFSVWMDIHEMSGSIYGSMAEAVENASVVIVAITKKYKDSDNTKKEAEYASQRKIPLLPLMLEEGYRPDGWLGILLGATLYIRVSPEDPTRCFEDIERHLRKMIEQRT